MTIQILKEMSIDELARMYEIEYGNYLVCALEPDLRFLRKLRGEYVGTIKKKINQMSLKMTTFEAALLFKKINEIEDKMDSAFYLLEEMPPKERRKLLVKNIGKLQTL